MIARKGMSLAEQILTAFLRSAAADLWNRDADWQLRDMLSLTALAVVRDADRALGMGASGQQVAADWRRARKGAAQ